MSRWPSATSPAILLLPISLLAAAASPVVDQWTATDRERRRRWQPGRGLAALLVFLAAGLVLVLGGLIVLATVGPDLVGLANANETVAVFESSRPSLALKVNESGPL